MLFKFFRNKGGQLPDDYDDVYICNALNITYTELYSQPYDWIEKMMKWQKMKTKVDMLDVKK